MQLSPRQTTAIVCVIDIALNGLHQPVSSKLIAARAKIHRRYLEQIMQPLVKANIVQSVRGPLGGYKLAREKRNIKVSEIIAHVGEVSNTAMCPDNPACQIVDMFVDDLRERADAWLADITIADLCHNAPMLAQSKAPVHFSI